MGYTNPPEHTSVVQTINDFGSPTGLITTTILSNTISTIRYRIIKVRSMAAYSTIEGAQWSARLRELTTGVDLWQMSSKESIPDSVSFDYPGFALSDNGVGIQARTTASQGPLLIVWDIWFYTDTVT